MAAITDLTFTQLAAASPANSIVLSNGTAPLAAGVYLNASNITGDTIDALTDTGVLELMFKIRQYAGIAQTTVNAAANGGDGPDPGEALAAFPPYAYSNISADGEVTVSQTSAFTLPVNFNTVLGQNV